MGANTSDKVIAFPPGPRSVVPGKIVGEFRRGPLQFFMRVRREYGDVAGFYAFGQKYVIVSHPDLAKDILLTEADAYWKGRALQNSRGILGEGLLTAEGESHKRQRRMMQPSFHAKHVEHYAGEIIESTRAMLVRWRELVEGARGGDGAAEVEIRAEMMGLTLVIAGKALFGTILADEIEMVRRCMDDLMGNFRRAVVPWGRLLNYLPLASTKRLGKARSDMKELVGRMIEARRGELEGDAPRAVGMLSGSADIRGESGCPYAAEHGTRGAQGTHDTPGPRADAGQKRTDLLSMMIAATDEEGGVRGLKMTDTQLRDQAITILMAGHETTANAMTFTLFLLAKHPEEQERLREEVRRVLGNREPGVGMLDELPYTRWVLSEAMRLYPPAWTLGRENQRTVEIGGYRIPAKCTVLIPQWAIHRDERFWERPDDFWPERWKNPTHPRYAYLPFSTGPRNCIGESFAWLEMIMALAMFVSEFRFELPAGGTGEDPPTMAAITLRPRNPVKLNIIRQK